MLRRLRVTGVGIIYVSHRLDEVFRIADRVTVLRDGRRVTTEAIADTTPADLVRHIVGRSLSELFIRPSEKAAALSDVTPRDHAYRREARPHPA